MGQPAPSRSRVKVSVTLDADLLGVVDSYVRGHAGLDRSKVLDRALEVWYRSQQDEAMADQFGEADLEVDPEERAGWRGVRRAAAARRMGRSD